MGIQTEAVRIHCLMFDKVYPFRKVNDQRGEVGTTTHLFVFTTPKGRDIIFEAHVHDSCPLAVVKFYDKAHRLSKNRFNLMNGSHEAATSIRTAIEIMLHLYETNPYLSFAFMGAADLETSNVETRRFRIYRDVLVRLFSEQEFQHVMNPRKSLYIMCNRAYCESKEDGQATLFQTLSSTYPEMKDL